MNVFARSLATTLANGSRKAVVRSHHRSRLIPQMAEAVISQREGASQLTCVPMAVQKQNFFGTMSGPNGSGENSSDTISMSPGQASITLEGGWTEEADNDIEAKKGTDENEETSSSVFDTPIVIEMPQVDANESGDQFFVEKWYKQPGDSLEKDDVLCEIATPDFVFGMQIDDEETGIMGEIHAEEGVKVPCHAPICTIYHKSDE